MPNKIIGIDIGGTAIKLALLDMAGVLIEKWSISTNISDNGSHIPYEIVNSIKGKFSQAGESLENLMGIGIGVPGPVDDVHVKRAVNLGWSNFPLKNIIEQALHVPVVLLNDANAAALGEFWKGTDVPLNDIVFITIGTGVGGGIIVNGQMVITLLEVKSGIFQLFPLKKEFAGAEMSTVSSAMGQPMVW